MTQLFPESDPRDLGSMLVQEEVRVLPSPPSRHCPPWSLLGCSLFGKKLLLPSNQPLSAGGGAQRDSSRPQDHSPALTLSAVIPALGNT